jgi:hypothetical protein
VESVAVEEDSAAVPGSDNGLNPAELCSISWLSSFLYIARSGLRG